MFYALARLCVSYRRPYLAVAEGVATADDHGVLPKYRESGRIGDAPSRLEVTYRAG